MPLHDLLTSIASKPGAAGRKQAIEQVRIDALTKASKADDAQTINAKDCRDTAADLLKKQGV